MYAKGASIAPAFHLADCHSQKGQISIGHILEIMSDGITFSVPKFLLFGARHLIDVFIFGKRGLDVRTRLVLLDAIKRRGPAPSENELKRVFLSILPLNYGNRFLTLAGLLTLALGAAFIALAPTRLAGTLLQIHRVFADQLYPKNYVVLAGQWLAFYLVMSVVSFLVIAAIATLSYSRLVSRVL